MTKTELREKIQSIVKQVYQPKQISLDNETNISLDAIKFPVLGKFPELKKVIESLLSKQYEIFISKIEWVAPKPTTFRIVLANDEVFYLIYTERSWIAKVEGKKYYLLNLGEEEQATETIARILSYGKTETDIDSEEESTSSTPSTKGPKPETSGGGEEPTPEEEPEEQ